VEAANQPESASRHSSQSEGGIKGWFRSLFGTQEEAEEQRDYEEAFRSGNTILALDTTEDNAERAAEVLNRHSPMNVHTEAGDASAETVAGTSVGTRGSIGNSQSRQSSIDALEKQPESIPVVREELKVGKRPVVLGGARIHSRVVEEPVEENVRLRRERLRIERKPVDRPASEADLRSGTDQVIEVKEYAEEPVVSKQARVTEEIRVKKDATEGTESVRDTVRHTEVNVENLNQERSGREAASSDLDRAFRADFASRYSDSGESYEAYAPAYGYGYEMANDSRYCGRAFDEVEPELRTEYARRHPDSTWDRIKESVRYGWNKVTGRTRSATASR
jgi:uncharacterized protein (TIGR02271 family)